MNQEIAPKTEWLRNKLNPIRDIVLKSHSIMVWEKAYHAPILAASVTAAFILLWIPDCTVLSKLCVTGILLTILDYSFPILNSYVADKKWTEKHETIFETCCENIARVWNNLSNAYSLFSTWKHSNTKLYYSSLLTSLLLLAWIGSLVHNLFLTYLIVLSIVFYPGMSHHNMFDKIIPIASSFIAKVFPKKTQEKNVSAKNVKKEK